MRMPFALDDTPYGTERSCNGLRLTGPLAHRECLEARVRRLGDSASCVAVKEKVLNGCCHRDLMVTSVLHHRGSGGCPDTCTETRTSNEGGPEDGARRSRDMPTGRFRQTRWQAPGYLHPHSRMGTRSQIVAVSSLFQSNIPRI